jgi:L-ascorbate metabolism protein UlaG (beta-lactamase superfamily)
VGIIVTVSVGVEVLARIGVDAKNTVEVGAGEIVGVISFGLAETHPHNNQMKRSWMNFFMEGPGKNTQ